MLELTTEQKTILYHIVTGIKQGKQQVSLGGFAGTGKAQPLDSLVITPHGVKQMGDLIVGDKVCTPSGETSQIIGIYPQGIKPIYRVWFNDGHFVECCDEHLWKCIDRRRLSNLKKYKTPYKIFPLSYIRSYLNKTDGKNRFYIETSAPIEFQNSGELPIDPYLMGVLLADGSITDNNFAIHSEDKEIINRCRTVLSNWKCELKYKEGVTYAIVGNSRGPHSSSVVIRNKLREINVWNCICDTKFIPSVFLNTSLKNRWELLRGLMDSDGAVDKRTGMVEYTTTSSMLAADICWLVESLGGICRIKHKKTKCVYKEKVVFGQAWRLNLSFNNTPDVFFLSRKKKLAKPRTKYLTRRCIRDIEYIGEKKAQCIMIDHPEHLYLTDHFIPTHNTTLIKYLIKFFPNFKVCAYTGKAANVLRKKGIEASTIHSLIYQPIIEDGILVGFDLADNLDADGVIIDEASMVSKEIYEDLKYFDLPLIFVGDHGQLEPIGSDFNLMLNPDFRLEQIHRNANEIAKFAQHLRMGYVARSFRPKTDRVVFLNSWNVTPTQMINVDQIICAFNKTRVGINTKVREILGFKGLLNVNEKIICLKNNKELMLFNGMQGTVRSLHKKKGSDRLDFEFDERVYPSLKYSKQFFHKERPDLENYGKDEPIPFDYAYGITTHKSQGDEWDKVMVYEQKSGMWNHRRWAYTAASRAAEQLVWVT